MNSELREAFDIIFGSIAPGYYVLAAIGAIALILFLSAKVVDYKGRVAQLDEKVRPIVAAFDIVAREVSDIRQLKNTRTALGYSGQGSNGTFKAYWHWWSQNVSLLSKRCTNTASGK